MNKGEILHHDGQKFKVQKVASDSIYASLMISDEKCQRGKPRRLFFTELAASLGISVDAFVSKLKSGQAVAKVVMKEQLAQIVEMPVEPTTIKEVPVSSTTAPAGKNALRDVLETFDTPAN